MNDEASASQSVDAAEPSGPSNETSVSTSTKVVIGILVAWLVVGGVFYFRDTTPVASALTAPAQNVAVPPASAEVAQEPVKFTNPFDKSEVFEYPPGTTEAEAREATSQVLLQRAMERKDQIYAKPLKRKREHLLAASK